MKRTIILAVISMLLCSTAVAIQGGRQSTRKRKPARKPRSPSALPQKVEPLKEPQTSAQPPKPVKLSAHDLQIIFQELLLLEKQKEIAADPEERKRFAAELKKLFALAHVAEDEGYAQRPEIESRILLKQDLALTSAYRKKNPASKIGDEEIAAYHLAHPTGFDDFLQANSPVLGAQGSQRDEIKKQWAELKVISQKAREQGLDRDDVTRLQMLVDRSQTLAAAYISELQKDAEKLVTAAEVNKYYLDHPADFEEIRVRHILIRMVTEQEAAYANDAEDSKDGKHHPPQTLTREDARKKSQLLLDRVRKGEDFAKLAKENSEDPGSKDNGGEYDFFGRGVMVVPFEEAAFALKPGEVSGLVETQFGFHIIKLEARRTAPPPAGNPKVLKKITEVLKQEKLEALIDEIADKSPVVVPEVFDTTPKTT